MFCGLHEIISQLGDLVYAKLNSCIFYGFLDISVFVGARSDVGQSKWMWNSEATIKNSDFPLADSSICQDMSWPLTYDDGINLRPQPCGNGRSYYVCQHKCKN